MTNLRTVTITFVTFLLLSVTAIAKVSATMLVKTESGQLEGLEEAGSIVFKGIPFAAPPVGELRWRAPQLAHKWPGIKIADQFSPICPQLGMYPPDSPPEPMNEDCLYLNIWVPKNPPAEKLPVMLWIYGGALSNGSASAPLYSGSQLTKQNVIVVTANYRLGVLGFLAHPILSKEADYGSSGNYGLLDQIAALQWINRNIASFGGNPESVTVFGQSSGSISISALTASQRAKGLFQRAIGQSGGIFEPIELFSFFGLRGAEKKGEEYMARLGAKTLAQMRQKSPLELMNTPFDSHLIVDGFALTKSPYNAYRAGEQNDIDLLVGTNADEGQLFLTNTDVTLGNFEHVLAKHFTKPIVFLMSPKPGASDADARTSASAFEGDMRFRWDMWRWAHFVSGRSKKKAFFYQFSQTPPYTAGQQYFGLGATHGMEMSYVFNNLDQQDLQWTASDKKLSYIMSAYWANFAKSGDPNAPGLPLWPEFKAADQQVMILSSDIRAEHIPNIASLERIDRGYSVIRFAIQNWLLSLVSSIVLVGTIILILAFTKKRNSRR